MSIELLAIMPNLFAWYNVVFIACFGIGLFFTLIQLIGLGHSDVGADHDMDHDIGHDPDHDVDHGVDVHPHVEASGDPDAHADIHGDAHADAHTDAPEHAADGAGEAIGAAQAVSQFVGVGRVPMSAIFMTLFYTVGITGWISNAMLRSQYRSDRALFFTSLALALIAGILVMRIASGLLGRYLPAVLTSALNRRQMVGLLGEAALPISERFGRASVKDKYGTLHQVNCKVPAGVEPIPKGTRVVLTKYLPGEDMYFVGRAG